MPKKRVQFPVPVYVDKPHCLQQALCKHRKLNGPETDCCGCGAHRDRFSRNFVYLDPKWYCWYAQGGPKPWTLR